MKKLIISTILLFVVTITFSQANFGYRVGVNLSDYTNLDTQKRTSYYFGVIVPIKFGKIYTFQPELNLSRQGATYHLSNTEDYELFSDYISTSIINKIKLNNKFSVMIAPYLSFRTNKDVSKKYISIGLFNKDNTVHLYNKGDVGFILGCEYNINKNISLEARYKQGVFGAIDLSYFIKNSYFDNDKFTQVFQVGINYKFILKQTKQ